MLKISSIAALFYCFMTVNRAAYEIEETVSKHYSVVREIKLYVGLDLSLYVEDLQAHIVKGDRTRVMVRFDILRKDYV